MRKKNIFVIFNLFLLICLFLVSCFLFLFLKKEQTQIKPIVKINNITIPVELADTTEKQTQGLSDRQELDKDNGMLFIFSDSKIRSFWMKNMHFPIDILWIKDNKIINISKNLPPEGEFPENTYSSEEEVNYVLEVNAGFCDDKGIRVGDAVNFKF